jgi:cytidyltransferase-like protein
MNGIRKDLTGIKYENSMLTFVEPKDNYKWLCRCDCGKTIITNSSSVKRGSTKSCGCLSPKLYPNTGEILGRYWSSTIRGAKKRNIPFLIDTNEAWKIYLDQDRKCNLTNLPIYFSKNAKKLSLGNASLDRVDNNEGYIVGNIQWLDKNVNLIKQNFSQQYFIDTAIKITKFNNQFSREDYEIKTKDFNFYIENLKHSARRRNIDFNLNVNDSIVLFEKQRGQCNLSGQNIDILSKRSTASIDRIDSNGPYIIDNLQWIHKDINRMKLNYDQEYFTYICNLIYKKYNNTIAIVSGYFQVLHSGHIDYIEAASNLGPVYAIVNNDNQVDIKGSYHFLDQNERLSLVSAIRGVEYSCLSIDTDGSVVQTLKKIRTEFPHHDLVFINSGDRQEGSGNINEVEFCKKNNIKILYDAGGKKINSSSWILKNFLDKYRFDDFSKKSISISSLGGCRSNFLCDKCGTNYVCDSSGKAGTKEGNLEYIWGPCACGFKCPKCN